MPNVHIGFVEIDNAVSKKKGMKEIKSLSFKISFHAASMLATYFSP